MGEAIRLNKYLADAGVCSRREADRLIEEGKVLVDGEIAAMGTKVLPNQHVVCDGKVVGEKEESVFLIVNKPKGIVCTTSDKDHAPNIVESRTLLAHSALIVAAPRTAQLVVISGR